MKIQIPEPHYHAVLIDNGSGKYQFYRGWDAIFTVRSNAEALLAKAQRIFPGAKPTSAGEHEARRLGWLGATNGR